MKRKPAIQIERAVLMRYQADERIPLFERALPTPPGKLRVTITRRNTKTGDNEERDYITRHEVARILVGLIGRQNI